VSRRLARLVARWWWLSLALWALALAAAAAAAPAFDDVATFDDAAFLPEDSRAAVGNDLLEEGWPDDNFTRAAVLAAVRDDAPLHDDDEAYLRTLIDWLRSPQAPDVFTAITSHYEAPDLAQALSAPDGHAVLVVAGFAEPPFSPEVGEAVRTLRQRIGEQPPPGGLNVYVTGPAGVALDEDDAIRATMARAQVLTVLLVVLLLLWIFRSPVAAVVPLATVAAGYTMALAVVSLLARAGMEVSYLFQTFAIVIVFGAGTDYSLLMMTRYDEELDLAERAGFHPDSRLRHATVVATMGVLGGVLASSAASTIVGFSAQSVAEFGLFRTMGPALAVAVAVTLVAGVTLTPALMRLFGPVLFWPSRFQLPRPRAGQAEPLIAREPERMS
jgi:putative drug exporter of the RND superfamily